MIIDPFNNGDVGRFEYYRKFDKPIRLVFDENGDVLGTNTLNPETGELIIAALIAEVDTNPHVEEITKVEFYKLCEDLLMKK